MPSLTPTTVAGAPATRRTLRRCVGWCARPRTPPTHAENHARPEGLEVICTFRRGERIAGVLCRVRAGWQWTGTRLMMLAHGSAHIPVRCALCR